MAPPVNYVHDAWSRRRAWGDWSPAAATPPALYPAPLLTGSARPPRLSTRPTSVAARRRPRWFVPFFFLFFGCPPPVYEEWTRALVPAGAVPAPPPCPAGQPAGGTASPPRPTSDAPGARREPPRGAGARVTRGAGRVWRGECRRRPRGQAQPRWEPSIREADHPLSVSRDMCTYFQYNAYSTHACCRGSRRAYWMHGRSAAAVRIRMPCYGWMADGSPLSSCRGVFCQTPSVFWVVSLHPPPGCVTAAAH